MENDVNTVSIVDRALYNNLKYMKFRQFYALKFIHSSCQN